MPNIQHGSRIECGTGKDWLSSLAIFYLYSDWRGRTGCKYPLRHGASLTAGMMESLYSVLLLRNNITILFKTGSWKPLSCSLPMLDDESLAVREPQRWPSQFSLGELILSTFTKVWIPFGMDFTSQHCDRSNRTLARSWKWLPWESNCTYWAHEKKLVAWKSWHSLGRRLHLLCGVEFCR